MTLGTSNEKREEETPAQSRLAGYVDAIVSGRVYGWAWDANDPARTVTVDIRHADEFVGSAEASLYREDLKNLGVGDGRHAFEFELPDHLRDLSPAGISIAFKEGSELARNSQLTLVSTATEDASGEPEAADATSKRMRRLEQNVDKLLNITLSMHGQLVEQRSVIDALRNGSSATSVMERRLDASFLALNRRIDEISKSVAGAEGFLLRTDQTLRDLSTKSNSDSPEPALRREIRGVGVILLCAILAVMTMLLA